MAESEGEMNGQHSSARASWGTPSVIVEFARRVLGRIDVDPFTSVEWNETVKAKHIHTEASDGFASPWVPGWPAPGENQFARAGDRHTGLTAFVNPPGNSRGVNARRAWNITEQYYNYGYLSGGVIWVCYSLGQFRTLQSGTKRSPLHSTFVRLIPKRRIACDDAPGVASKSPSHDSAIVLMPPLDSRGNPRPEKFIAFAKEFGDVL